MVMCSVVWSMVRTLVLSASTLSSALTSHLTSPDDQCLPPVLRAAHYDGPDCLPCYFEPWHLIVTIVMMIPTLIEDWPAATLSSGGGKIS